ncbi:MAG: 3'-5' exoribonuclease domain-containing protein [Solirubrobacteraceae bacterium]
MRARKATDLYLSLDIETDGPIPGPYSMLSLGACVAGRFNGEVFERLNPTSATFYIELRPIAETSEPAALKVTQLDRAALVRSGADPADAMNRFVDWIAELADKDRPIVCAYPAGFDWMFLYWYLQSYASDQSSLRFSSVLDVKTMYAVKARVPFERAGLDDLPPFLRSSRRHTHNALDDALQQADVFANIFEWAGA